MSDLHSLHGCIILDARCIINLYASMSIKSIFDALPQQMAMAAYVYEGEALRIYNGPPEDVMGQSEALHLQPIIDEKLLHIISPDQEELNTAVNLSSARIATGEAITAAIAIHRQWSLGTDDRVISLFLKQKWPELCTISTLDVLKQWADTTHAQLTGLSISLNNIRQRARYRPHETHPLYEWWKKHHYLR